MTKPTLFLLAAALCAAPLFGAAAEQRAAERTVTFNRDVAPIVFANCSGCHRPGQSAPFSLLSYSDAHKRGRLLKAVTETRYMPPWHAEPGWGHFKDERRLSDEQIAVIGKWVSQGMQEGEAKDLPALPDFPEGWQLGEPDLVVEMEQAYEIPADGPDIYRNFVAATGTTEDKWVRAIEFRPKARTVMHHSLFKADESGAARKRDEQDEEPGFGGMGAGVHGLVNLGGWAVGGNARIFPDESPTLLPAGSDFIFQSHFHPSGKVESEVSAVGIYYADEPATRKKMTIQLPPLFGAGAGIDIQPGDSEYTIREQFTTPVAIEIHSAAPHAHYIGKSFKAWATLPNGAEVPLIHVPDWDFAWQSMYNYAEPVKLPAGSTMYTEIVYDNSADNPRNPSSPPKRVTWGEASTEEMGSISFIALAAEEADMPVVKEAYGVLVSKHVRQRREQRKNRVSTIRRTRGGEE